jgi:hypothetical protein
MFLNYGSIERQESHSDEEKEHLILPNMIENEKKEMNRRKLIMYSSIFVSLFGLIGLIFITTTDSITPVKPSDSMSLLLNSSSFRKSLDDDLYLQSISPTLETTPMTTPPTYMEDLQSVPPTLETTPMPTPYIYDTTEDLQSVPPTLETTPMPTPYIYDTTEDLQSVPPTLDTTPTPTPYVDATEDLQSVPPTIYISNNTSIIVKN